MGKQDQTKRHHHGNLREALITAAIDILGAGGPDALTLRKCAARAGVSHAAPAHHFNGLVSLKIAVIARGHDMFADTMHRARDRAEQNPHARLNAICQGYLEFATTHTDLFKFMFQPHGALPDSIDTTTGMEISRASMASYGVLRDACAPFEHDRGGNLGTETMVWSLVHGYAMLFSTNTTSQAPFGPIPDFNDILPKLLLKSDPAQ